jgi:hypothetical protein
MTNGFWAANKSQEHTAIFHPRFWRCYRLLYFMQTGTLGGPERADDSVERCRLAASRNSARFAYEGESRSWLIRVLSIFSSTPRLRSLPIA